MIPTPPRWAHSTAPWESISGIHGLEEDGSLVYLHREHEVRPARADIGAEHVTSIALIVHTDRHLHQQLRIGRMHIKLIKSNAMFHLLVYTTQATTK